jgi:hypothetical protein
VPALTVLFYLPAPTLPLQHQVSSSARDIDMLSAKLNKLAAEKAEVDRQLAHMRQAYQGVMGRGHSDAGHGGTGGNPGTQTPLMSATVRVRW